jgi:hypothetical protein
VQITGHGDRAISEYTKLARLLSCLQRTALVVLLLGLAIAGGCSSIRITDPDHTADELYLENVASKLAVDQVSATVLRDRRVFLDSIYLTAATQPSDQQQYMIGELRAKLLLSGVRLTAVRKDAEIILEPRSQGISVNHIEFLLGVPASSVGGIFTGGIAATTPELSLLKTTNQHGFSSIAFVAYWADTGEVVAASGPFVGRTTRDDYWFFGAGPRTLGNVPPAEPAPIEATGPVDQSTAAPAPEAAPVSQPPPVNRPIRQTHKP